jgi:hypothetical protein
MVKTYQYGIGIGVGLYTLTFAIGFYGGLIGRNPNEAVVMGLGLLTAVLLIPSTAWGTLQVIRKERSDPGDRRTTTADVEQTERDPAPFPPAGPTTSPPAAESPTTTAPPDEIGQPLRDLQSLFEQGLLTEDEYERKRRKLLRVGDGDSEIPT